MMNATIPFERYLLVGLRCWCFFMIPHFFCPPENRFISNNYSTCAVAIPALYRW